MTTDLPEQSHNHEDLAERVRSGSVPEERLALAAYLGDEPSRNVLGPKAPELVHDLATWCERLETESPEAQGRIGLVVAEWVGHLTWAKGNPAVIPAERYIAEEDRSLFDGALRALSAWVMRPDDNGAAERAAKAAEAIRDSARSSERLLVGRAVALIAAGEEGDARAAIQGNRNVTAAILGAQRIFEQDPRPAIREAVVPWALGLRRICAPKAILRGRFAQELERFEAVQRGHAEDPRWKPAAWSKLLFIEQHQLEGSYSSAEKKRWRLSRAHLLSPEDFEDRFVQLLDEARCDWINFSAHGVLDDALVVAVETGDHGGTDNYPVEWIHVMPSGPMIQTGFDLHAHTEVTS